MGLRREPAEDRHRIQQLLGLVWVGLVAAAVVKELRTPSEERTRHGVVAGFVPYDFRVPTVARLRERVWAPEDEHLLNPHPFGSGGRSTPAGLSRWSGNGSPRAERASSQHPRTDATISSIMRQEPNS
jgi:hypothetical protein